MTISINQLEINSSGDLLLTSPDSLSYLLTDNNFTCDLSPRRLYFNINEYNYLSIGDGLLEVNEFGDNLATELTPYEIGFSYLTTINNLTYSLNRSQVYLNYNLLKASKYTVDSANTYTLYINNGIDYSITIPTTVNVTDLTLYGDIRVHPTSKTFYEFTITKNNSNTITISLPSQESFDMLEGKYSFDIIGINNNDVRVKIISGDVIVQEIVTKI